MKIIIVTCFATIFALSSFAQCTTAEAEATPLTWIQSNAYKYIGANGKENKANTEAMCKKMAQIFELFASAFKNNKGFIGRWKAQVDNKNGDGLVKGLMDISMTKIICKDNGELNKSNMNGGFGFTVYVNGFVPQLVRDKQKQPNFILDKDKVDSLNGQTVYYIEKAQEKDPLMGFPLHFYNWDNYKNTSIIMSKSNIPLFKPISIGEFMGLFKKWTTAYNAVWKGKPNFIATPEDIDKFTSKCSKEFLAKPIIYVWDGSEQVVYLRKTSYTDDVTLGRQWVTLNPNYLGKNVSETSVQFISLEFYANGGDEISTKILADFKNNFDFKKLQSLLGK